VLLCEGTGRAHGKVRGARVRYTHNTLHSPYTHYTLHDRYDAPPPEGFAVWRVDPNLYDPKAADGYAGGKLYECEPSPPMLAIDNDGNCWSAQVQYIIQHAPYTIHYTDDGNCWSAQDQSPNLCMINARTHEVEQIDVPHPMCLSKTDMRITGPSIDMAPDGSIW
jgi:hypothetical protein